MYKCNHKDRISKLPEEMIHHILSFLLIKDATQTSVLSKTWKTVEFKLNEFGATIRPSQQNNVHLKVARQNHLTKQTAAAFVNGLVWSTYPTTLTILGYCRGMIEYLCKKLASKGRDGCCCEQFCNKFWWHNIEDFEAKSGNIDMKENLASMVKMHNNSTEKSCFTFKWRFDLH
ncbi:hypothetical protein BVRB_009680 isoform B [Beta vulgaris subsp. vulgaris]|uniref:F-box domain-containing protein n=1 Tax=Beta vulgaris subsp. vulgaris TaxID=3555 RepID=A0A0J8B2S0_BETVV|nr:hypothetical protein BVRB_009680 isoform B [Beta vulgaris subsp. vulgaris]